MQVEAVKTILIFVAAFSIGIWIIYLIPSDWSQRPYKQQGLPRRTRKVLERAECFVLLSLDPTAPNPETESGALPREMFYGWPVVRKKPIFAPEEQAELLNELYQSIEDADHFSELCFKPRHGISATLGKETVNLVICFECLFMQVFHTRAGVKHLTRSALPVFERALAKGNVACS